MVKYNVTVDDISPLVSYDGRWSSRTIEHRGGENNIQSFSGNTLHVTNTTASAATIEFSGQAISVWGPWRSDSSGYKIILDGQLTQSSGLDNEFNESKLLFAVSNLAPGLPHTLQIVNAPLDPDRPFLRIDKFEVESGTDGGGNSETIIDDTDPIVQYQPNESMWLRNSDDSDNQSAYRNATLHAIQVKSSHIRLTVKGDSIELYGGLDRTFSSYAVTVNGSGRRQFTPNLRDFHTQVLLFHAEFLQSDGTNTVDIETLEDERFEFDFARVIKYGDAGAVNPVQSTAAQPTNTPAPPEVPSNIATTRKLTSAMIVGITLGSLAILVLLGLVFFLLWRRKRRRKVPPSATFVTHLDMARPRRSTPIYAEFSSRSQSALFNDDQSVKRSIDGLDLLDGQPQLSSPSRGAYGPYIAMYKTGAVRSSYEPSLRPEDSASLRVRSPPPSEVGQSTHNDRATYFTPTISGALPPVPELPSAPPRW